MADLPKHARVVIVGGGVIGCSIAYHLGKLGWSDVVLIERKQLTSGTTWHAAGLVGQLRQSMNMTRLARYTAELYRGLEAETGQATGFRQCGSVSLATTPGRMEELTRNASMAKVFGLPVHVVSPREIAELYPLANLDDVIGGIHIPSDGYANAVDITQALAKGARAQGVKIFQDLKVTRIRHDGRRVAGVDTEQGSVDAQYVVLCAGMWTRDLAASIGVTVPLQACEHYYVLFQDVPGLDARMPVLRDYDHCSYFKYDAGKLLVGAFEPNARPWGTQGIPEDFSFGEIEGDFSHFEPVLMDAMRRVPALEGAGIQKFFCGPESFTPGCALSPRRIGGARELLRRRRLEFHRTAIRGRHRQGRVRMDPRRPSAGRSVGSGRTAQYAVSGEPQVLAGAGTREPRSFVCDALAVPPVRDRARRAALRRARAPRPRGRLLRGGVRLGARELVRARRRRAGLRVQLRAAELVRGERPRAPRRAQRRRPLRSVLVRQVSPRGIRCGTGTQPRVRERHRRRSGQDGVHAMAQ